MRLFTVASNVALVLLVHRVTSNEDVSATSKLENVVEKTHTNIITQNNPLRGKDLMSNTPQACLRFNSKLLSDQSVLNSTAKRSQQTSLFLFVARSKCAVIGIVKTEKMPGMQQKKNGLAPFQLAWETYRCLAETLPRQLAIACSPFFKS